MSIISATRRAMREMADGTIRVQIDIDPRFRDDFLKFYGKIDMPVALAPLVADFEKREEKAREKVGPLCMLAVQWCKDPEFWRFCTRTFTGHDACNSEAAAADLVKFVCEVNSRKELDQDSVAGDRFKAEFRSPYMDWARGHRQ